jgi:hypothetical protein
MTPLNRCRPALKLFRHRCARLIVLWRVTRIVAVDTSSYGDRSISIRTGEVQPEANLVDPRIKGIFQQAVIGIVAPAVPLLA